MINNVNKIAELTEEIERLRKEKEAFERMSDDQKLAEKLHEKQCHWNHTDGCGWYYENWDNPGYSKNEYLKKAQNILKDYTYEQACLFINKL